MAELKILTLKPIDEESLFVKLTSTLVLELRTSVTELIVGVLSLFVLKL